MLSGVATVVGIAATGFDIDTERRVKGSVATFGTLY
jgi:hypothetical protein